jgi:multidrug efflux pump subunit AcrA (membrane-fusion protein)
MDENERWEFLFRNPAVADPGWLPPQDEVPELADLRADHERLLAARSEASRAAFALRQRREQEVEAQRAARQQALLDGEAARLPKLTVTEAKLAAAVSEAEAAQDALQSFVQRAVAQVVERESDLLTGLDKITREAEGKRTEAQALLDEAERMEAGTKRLRHWLSRATGRSALGLYPYGQMTTPGPDGGDLTVRELWEQANPPGFETVSLVDSDIPPDGPTIETIDLDAVEEEVNV